MDFFCLLGTDIMMIKLKVVSIRYHSVSYITSGIKHNEI